MRLGKLIYRSAVVAGGVAIDRAIGDPVRPTHPARLLGRAIEGYEWAARRVVHTAEGERQAGLVLAAGLPLATLMGTAAALRLVPRPLRPLAEAWLVGTALASRDLADAARRVDAALDESVEAGRAAVAMIVGRDTRDLDEDDIVRATVETVAENTSDGMVAPLFYAYLGGAPLALAFKAVSTLDSMVGYRNERYEDLGRASARLDDAANLLPARLTAVLAVLAGRGGDPRPLAAAWADRVHHASPNAGLVEAAFAQGARLRLGGPAVYGGRRVERPFVGASFPPPQRQDIERVVALSDRVGLLAAAGGLLLLWVGRLDRRR